jgi:hypothetical protein
MMQRTRFYKPSRADLTDLESMFASNSLNKKHRRGAELDVPDFDFAAPSSFRPIMTRRIGKKFNKGAHYDPDYAGMGAFQITYDFSSAIRINNFPMRSPYSEKVLKEYGASGWSFRMLYEFLCENYNNGIPFVDTYFESVFKTRPVHADFLAIYETIREEIANEQVDLFHGVPLKADGTPDERYAITKKLKDYKVWQYPVIKRACEDLAKKIRADVENCLASGILPLSGKHGNSVSSRTAYERQKLQYMKHPNRLFYASGQLIKNLNIYIELGARREVA